MNRFSLIPDYSYAHPVNSEQRVNLPGPIDPGAYDFQLPLSAHEIHSNDVLLHPNPASHSLSIEGATAKVNKFYIYNNLGNKILEQPFHKTIDIAALEDGYYRLVLENQKGHSISLPFVKFTNQN
ncbi:MAG: T9SS type A sorting domain-containing protein [Saprospiraceae bacterium]